MRAAEVDAKRRLAEEAEHAAQQAAAQADVSAQLQRVQVRDVRLARSQTCILRLLGAALLGAALPCGRPVIAAALQDASCVGAAPASLTPLFLHR